MLPLNRRLALWGLSTLAIAMIVTSHQPVSADPVPVHLYVRDGALSTVDGQSLPALCYAPTSIGSAELPSPVLRAIAGDALEITLHNLDDVAHGLEIVRARSFNHLGPGQNDKFVASAIASRIVDNERTGAETIRVGNLEARRDFTDVRDVVRAYRALVVDGKSQNVYNVGSGICQRSGDLLEQFLEIAKSQREVVEVDPGRRQHPIADLSRIKSHTNWMPRIGIKKTLEDILDYWQQRTESP